MMVLIKKYYLIGLNRLSQIEFSGIELGLEEISQSLLEVDSPFRLIVLNNHDLKFTSGLELEDDLVRKNLRVLRGQVRIVRQEDVAPVVSSFLGLVTMETIVDLDVLGLGDVDAKAISSHTLLDLDVDLASDAHAREVGSQFRQAGQQTAFVLKYVFSVGVPVHSAGSRGTNGGGKSIAYKISWF